MSAVLRLTEESIVCEKGAMVMRAPTVQAVDYYLSRGLSMEGQHKWTEDETARAVAPFHPIAIRVCDSKLRVVDTARSVEQNFLEVEYELDEPITGLRVGIYLMSTRGEIHLHFL
jgi:lipopolysaccharide transport system ATP-binding protein